MLYRRGLNGTGIGTYQLGRDFTMGDSDSELIFIPDLEDPDLSLALDTLPDQVVDADEKTAGDSPQYCDRSHQSGSRADSFFSSRRNFGRGQNPVRNQNQPPNRANASSPSAYSPSALGPATIPAAPASPSLTQTLSNNDQSYQSNQHNQNSGKTPLFFKEANAGFIVKGNFTTLSAKPVLLEEGEWLGHQGELVVSMSFDVS